MTAVCWNVARITHHWSSSFSHPIMDSWGKRRCYYHGSIASLLGKVTKLEQCWAAVYLRQINRCRGCRLAVYTSSINHLL